MLYMAVTPDEFELPLAVADTTKELAELRGVNHNTLRVSLAKGQSGALRGEKYVRIGWDEPTKVQTVIPPQLARFDCGEGVAA